MTERIEPDFWGSEVVGRFEYGDLGNVYDVTVESEVPTSRVLGRLPRRGNRYYPTFVHVGTGFHRDGEEMRLMLMVDDARTLADAITKAADLAEQTDKSDLDECGHWWPCNGCKK